MSMKNLQDKLRTDYYGKPDIMDPQNTVHIMVVLTAALEHDKGERHISDRCTALKELPRAMMSQMHLFFGDNIKVHLTHFYDALFEYTVDDFQLDHAKHAREFSAFNTQNPDEVMGILNYLESFGLDTRDPDYPLYGESYVFDVDKLPTNSSTPFDCVVEGVSIRCPESLDDVLRRMDAIFFVGGETHWLNRQIKKTSLKTRIDNMLQNDLNKPFVFGGFSAGIINTGKVTTLAAAKRTMTGNGDFLGNISDADGNVMSMDYYDSDYDKRPVPFVPPNHGQVEDDDGRVLERAYTYDGLNRLENLLLFPHYKYDPWEPQVIAPCLDKNHVEYGKFGAASATIKALSVYDIVRITDRMLIFFFEGRAHYVFQDSRIQAYVNHIGDLRDVAGAKAVFALFTQLKK